MTTESALTRYVPPSVVTRWILCTLALAAIAISSLLLYKSLAGGTLPGCSATGTFDCDSVLATRWSHVLGVPVSAMAIAMYLALLVCLQMTASNAQERSRAAWKYLIILSAAILGSAVWFVGLQVYLGSYCLYCMLAHALGGVLAISLLGLAPKGPQRVNPSDTTEPLDILMIPKSRMAVLAIAGLLVTASLVTTQLIFKPAIQADVQLVQGQPDIDTGKTEGARRAMSILGGKVRLEPYQYPMIGSPDADKIIVYLFDYTCPNCRDMHHQLEKAVVDLKGKLGVVMLAVPLDSKCNPYVEKTIAMHQSACALAELSLAVFLADREKLHAFDAWVSQGQRPPGVDEARAKAVELVGEQALAKQLASGEISKRIQGNITVYGLTGGTVVPQFVMGNVRIFSRPDPDQMMALFKEHLGIEP